MEVNCNEAEYMLYLKNIKNIPFLTKEEEHELGERIAEGDKEARNTLVTHNLKLAVKIAKKYAGSGVPMPDLIQYGNFGLMMAAERFDNTKDCKFSTYAVYWIMQSIIRNICTEGRLIRIPVRPMMYIMKLKKAVNAYKAEHGRDPDTGELAEILDVSEGKVRILMEWINDADSLDREITNSSEDDTICLGDMIENGTNVEREAEAKYNIHMLKNAMQTVLDEKERYIITHRRGLFGNNESTLEEVGKSVSLSKERVRQIENTAIKKLTYFFTTGHATKYRMNYQP